MAAVAAPQHGQRIRPLRLSCANGDGEDVLYGCG
jgi:hypothetical protein